MRTKINFNEAWQFTKETDWQHAKNWETVTLPHTWNAADGQDGGNDYYRGTCTYAKKLSMAYIKNELSKTGAERVFLEFMGAAMTADLYVNGVKLAHHEGGYSTFRVDITDELKEENLICVAVDNSENDHVYPQKADFTFYGGLYRDVNLILVPQQHFELVKNGTSGIKVTPKIEGERAIVTVETWQCKDGEVKFTLEDQGMPIVQVSATSRDGYAKAELILENVHLWDGVKDPYLYVMKAELLSEGEIKDQIQTRFGCRTFSFDKENGFYLNGKPYPLRGVSRHQDRAGVGNALTLEMHREDMEIMKEIGANTVRLAHYQQAQEFYDLADEAGMVVWAEIPYITQHLVNGRNNTISQMRELITQNYNHPSIICWGLSNEITASGSAADDLMENHIILNDLCHEMDHTRPTTMAHVFMLETDSPLIDIPDIGSYNLYFGWYLGNLDQNDSFFDEFHEKYPDRIIGFSEYGADANPKFQTGDPDRGDYSEQYQCVYHEHILKCIEERPYIWASHVWNLFDFAADGRDEGGAHGVNQKGLVSMDRKVRKDAFYLYKAAWSREPMVHICGRRYIKRTEAVTEVKVYSNQPEVALFVDGNEIERKSAERVFVFQVPISGEHIIEAKAGECTDKIQVQKTAEPCKEYIFQKEAIINWFDREELNRSCFSIQDTLGELKAHPQASIVLGKLMKKASASRGDVASSTEDNENLQKMMAGMTVMSVLKQVGDAIKPEEIKVFNAELQKIKK